MIQSKTAFILAALGGAALVAISASPASAQDGASRGWTVTIGAGAQTFPKYPGADSYGITPLPIFGVRRGGTAMPFYAQDDGVGIGLLGRDSVINLGPVINLANKREEDDVGAPVGDVGFTIEAGGFVELFPTRSLRLRGELRQGINGHKGMVGSMGADLIVRDENTYIFSVGPRARWADSDYQQAYFGVTPAVSAATGLANFTPRSGFYAIGATSTLTYRIGRNWGLRGYAGYDRLIRNAADSPIVRRFGSRDQFSGGAGLFIEFNVGG